MIYCQVGGLKYNAELFVLNKVFFYTCHIPLKTVNGFVVRNYTNLKLYLELGYKVSGVYVVNETNPDMKNIDDHFPDVDWEILIPSPVPIITQMKKRVGYWLGFNNSWLLDSLYNFKSVINKDLKRKKAKYPDAIFHFESITTACGVYGIPNINSIWSNHDYVSERFIKIRKHRKINYSILESYKNTLHYNRLKKSEDLIAYSSNLIITISESETKKYKQRWQTSNIHLLPMSWSEEGIINKKENWTKNGMLNLLHLGQIDGFLGSQSLQYILLKVFPLIPKDKLEKIKLSVVGQIGSSNLSIEMKKLISSFPNVELFGFIKDLKSVYKNSDLQVVAATLATGSRTRIIESLVFGLPVLSAYESADGLIGMENNENILLSRDPSEFANHLVNILNNPHKLSSLRSNGRATYDKYYHSTIGTQKLGHLLEKYVAKPLNA